MPAPFSPSKTFQPTWSASPDGIANVSSFDVPEVLDLDAGDESRMAEYERIALVPDVRVLDAPIVFREPVEGDLLLGGVFHLGEPGRGGVEQWHEFRLQA